MTDYSSMSHQQLYDYVNSGSPSDVQSEAELSTNHGKSVTTATNELQQTLAKIQSAWSGAAADQFSQQANAIVNQMQQHAQNADQVGSVMNYASQYLSWAQDNMPSPPSEAEQLLADVNDNSLSEWGGALLTGGASYVASKAAQEDIAKKKAVATQVMTQLASAYTSAQSQLPPNDVIDGGTDPGGGNPPGTNTKGSTSGSGNGSNVNGGGGNAVMPMPIAMPIAGNSGGGGDSGGGSGSGTIKTPLTTPVGGGASGSGSNSPGPVSVSNPPTTVTSGIGDQPSPVIGGTGVGGTSGIGGVSGVGGVGSIGGTSGTGMDGIGGMGGIGGFGGGTGGLGGGGLGGLSDESEAGLGGAGGFGGSGSGTGSALSGGTGTGELGEEAGGTGYGTTAGAGSSSAFGPNGAAAGAAGEGATGSNAEQGMMGGGMGRGGMGGGGQEERGGRASWLKEDPDYWYGDKMKNAAPPGGVIE